MKAQYLTSALKTKRVRSNVMMEKYKFLDEFDDLYQEMLGTWQDKARRLQARRWRRIRREVE